MNQTQVPTLTVPSWIHLATAFMVPLSVHVTLLTHYSLDTSYCIPFRKPSITHSSVFHADHSIYRISTQQWISRNLFTFEPMLIGTFSLNYGWGITRRSLWHRFWDTLYVGSMFLRHVGRFLPHYTVLIPEDCNFLISNISYSRRPFFIKQEKTFLTCIWIWKSVPVDARSKA